MSIASSPRFLSLVLLADAAMSLSTGAAQLAATESLSRMLNLPAGLLAGTGWFYVVYSAVAAAIGTRDPVPRALATVISLGNFGWAALCVLAVMSPWLAPSAAGVAWILVQAVAVAVLGELQWLGLRRSQPSLARA